MVLGIYIDGTSTKGSGTGTKADGTSTKSCFICHIITKFKRTIQDECNSRLSETTGCNLADLRPSYILWERASNKVKSGTTLKTLVPLEKIFSSLRDSNFSRVIPLDIWYGTRYHKGWYWYLRTPLSPPSYMLNGMNT